METMGNMHAKKTAAHGFVNVIINTTIMWVGITSPKRVNAREALCETYSSSNISISIIFGVSHAL